MYTNLEPFYAHSVLPCFDQPNLKAAFKVFVACKESWTVISSGDLVSVTCDPEEVKTRYDQINSEMLRLPTLHGGFAIHEFEETINIPTYSFAVCAGHYVKFEDNVSE